MDQGTAVGTTLLSCNIIVELLLGMSLKKIWSAVNIMQFIVFYHLIKVNLAAHSKIFLTKLKVIALGEFIPYKEIASKTKEYLNLQKESLFNETDIDEELGSTFLAGVALFIITLFLFTVNLLRNKFGAAI